MSNPVDSNEPRSIRAGGPKITDRDAADFRRREARTRARRQQEEADLEMAAKIIEMEEAPHKAALELRGAKARAEERAENAYAQIEKRQFEEREQRRRQREEEERVAYAQYAEESKERRRQREQKEEQRAARDDRNEAEAE